jgi:phosphoenolpyruvate carboxykinase (ATP)
VTEPQATFSACFGAAFLVWHPIKYAEMLAEKMRAHGSQAWLINTGWSGGAYGTGSRMKLSHTRAIIDAIHAGRLQKVETLKDPVFGLNIPRDCPGCPREVLIPRQTWQDASAYDVKAQKLARLFHQNFEKYADAASNAIKSAGPQV